MEVSTILDSVIYPVADEMASDWQVAPGSLKAPDTVLFGEGGLDSMSLVTFVVAVEDRIEDTLDAQLSLATERAMSRSSSPFRTLGALAEFVKELLDEAGGG